MRRELSSTGLKGELTGDIGGLTELRSLDLSFNPGLTGSLSPRLGDLKKLNVLVLAGCSFNVNIPDELGNLAELTYFHLNENKLSGSIPPQLFSSEMILIDLLLDGNMFSGFIPMTLGLVHTLEVLRLNGNLLTGIVPSNLKNLTNVYELLFGNPVCSGSGAPNLTFCQPPHQATKS
ncbi:leucine-rich repeat receptor protein kinase HPCA1-like [Malus domestica]|uniref:leucine-rich repeat receptor protein kinase HPCA1-like n=1 Tax=Malus domestica TaxID=3750 RepID=UPI0039750E14